MSSFGKKNCFHNGNGKDLGCLMQVHFLLRVFPFFENRQTNVVLLWWWASDDFMTIGTLDLKKSYHYSGLSPMGPNEVLTCLDDGAARAHVSG